MDPAAGGSSSLGIGKGFHTLQPAPAVPRGLCCRNTHHEPAVVSEDVATELGVFPRGAAPAPGSEVPHP